MIYFGLSIREQEQVLGFQFLGSDGYSSVRVRVLEEIFKMSGVSGGL